VLVYVVAIVVALLIVPLTGGQLRRLGRIELRRVWLLFAGLGLQILLELIDLPRARYDDLGLAILLASYVLIIGFGLSNLLLTGMGVITVGIAMNAFVIALNQGMPYRVPEGTKTETTVKHRPEQPDDVLPGLGDSIAFGDPVNESISFGDLVIAVGLVDLTFRASRRSRRSHKRSRAEGDGQLDIDLAALDASEVTPHPDGGATPATGVDPDRALEPARYAGGASRNPLERVEHSRVVDVTGT
jgi:hypothetical protein